MSAQRSGRRVAYAPPPDQPCCLCTASFGADPVGWCHWRRRYAHAACIDAAEERRRRRAQWQSRRLQPAPPESAETAEIRRLMRVATGAAGR